MRFFIYLCAMLIVAPAISLGRDIAVVVPLENKTGNTLLDWIGFSPLETAWRFMEGINEPVVWDPFWLQQIGWKDSYLEEDTAIIRMASQWKWRVVVGGSFWLHDDSITANLACIRIKDDTLKRQAVLVNGSIADPLVFCKAMVDSLSALLCIPAFRCSTSAEMFLTDRVEVYATFSRGFGYEVQALFSRALYSYSTVISMDRKYMPAICRRGILYSSLVPGTEGISMMQELFAAYPGSPRICAGLAKAIEKGGGNERFDEFVKKHITLLMQTAAGTTMVAQYYMHKGEYDRAIAILERERADRRENAEVENELGMAYLATGQGDCGAELFKSLTQRCPAQARYHTYLGLAYQKQGRIHEAIAVLTKALEFDSTQSGAFVNLANVYMAAGWYDRATWYLNRARMLDPESITPVVNLAVAYQLMGKSAEAMSLLSSLRGRENGSIAIKNNLAGMRLLDGKPEDAEKLYKQALANSSQSGNILLNLAFVYCTLRRYNEALGIFESIITMHPDRGDVLDSASRCAEQAGKLDKAVEYVKKMVAMEPDNSNRYEYLVDLLARQKKFKEAIQIIESRGLKNPQEYRLRIVHAELYRGMGQYGVAVTLYRNLRNDAGFRTDPAVYLGLGRSMYDCIQFTQATNYEEAIYILKMARQYDPVNPEPDILIGLIYARYRNYPDMAREYWEQALKKAGSKKEKESIEQLLKGLKP